MEEPRYELASIGARLGALVLDWVMIMIGGTFLVFGAGAAILSALVFAFADEETGGVEVAIGLLLIGMALVLAYSIWWLFALRNGQTPGKQIVGIRAVDLATGKTTGWGRMFVRQFLVKGFVIWVNVLAGLVMGDAGVPAGLSFVLLIVWLLDHLWALWDENNQALHDKVMGTTIARKAPGA
ncbi:MAG: RDD family protein [bacterium]|nr:RDD family protein [bacterium]